MFCSNLKLVSLKDTYFLRRQMKTVMYYPQFLILYQSLSLSKYETEVLTTYLKESVRWRMNHWCRFWFDSVWLCCMSTQEGSSLSFEFSFTRHIFSQPGLTQTTLHKVRRSRLGHPGILITYTISNPMVNTDPCRGIYIRFFSVHFSSFSVVTGLKKLS